MDVHLGIPWQCGCGRDRTEFGGIELKNREYPGFPCRKALL
jgi:hypothetical protein